MGRFDALTQIDEKPEKPTPSPVNQSPIVNNQQNQAAKIRKGAEKKPANPQTRLPASQSPTLDALERPEKYTTRLEPSLIRKIRIHAAEKEIKDYEVVKKALKQYFDYNK